MFPEMRKLNFTKWNKTNSRFGDIVGVSEAQL